MNKKTELGISLTEKKVVKVQAQELKQYIKDSGYNYAQTFFCMHVEGELGQLLKNKFKGFAFAYYFNTVYNLYYPKRRPLDKGMNEIKGKYLDFIIKHGKLPADSTVLKWNNNMIERIYLK